MTKKSSREEIIYDIIFKLAEKLNEVNSVLILLKNELLLLKDNTNEIKNNKKSKSKKNENV